MGPQFILEVNTNRTKIVLDINHDGTKNLHWNKHQWDQYYCMEIITKGTKICVWYREAFRLESIFVKICNAGIKYYGWITYIFLVFFGCWFKQISLYHSSAFCKCTCIKFRWCHFFTVVYSVFVADMTFYNCKNLCLICILFRHILFAWIYFHEMLAAMKKTKIRIDYVILYYM